ncbi:MAG TPA: hypothetical protein VHG51_14095, partial [Longimicrobiaceae bacterium]|nr:hypothetical protein [Longimicrobiaceae bacterium]
MSEKKRKPRAVREPAAAYEAPPTEEAAMRKNYRLRQSKIDRAMRVLGTSTETETIERALELVVFRGELLEGV